SRPPKASAAPGATGTIRRRRLLHPSGQSSSTPCIGRTAARGWFGGIIARDYRLVSPDFRFLHVPHPAARVSAPTTETPRQFADIDYRSAPSSALADLRSAVSNPSVKRS